MRQILDHTINPANEALYVDAVDEPGHGGANHEYQISSPGFGYTIKFQNGPINEVGVNGVTNEALMAVCVDRLRGFQNGPYACRENALALTKLEEALHWLHSRTRARAARGVEGTHTV